MQEQQGQLQRPVKRVRLTRSHQHPVVNPLTRYLIAAVVRACPWSSLTSPRAERSKSSALRPMQHGRRVLPQSTSPTALEGPIRMQVGSAGGSQGQEREQQPVVRTGRCHHHHHHHHHRHRHRHHHRHHHHRHHHHRHHREVECRVSEVAVIATKPASRRKNWMVVATRTEKAMHQSLLMSPASPS